MVKIIPEPVPSPEGPVQTCKKQGRCVVNFGKLTSYTWGRCSILLTSIRFQSIFGSVLFILLNCAVMDLAVSSTLHSGHGVCIQSCSQYYTPKPMHHRPTASSNMPDRSDLGWNVIVWYFATFLTSPYHRKRPMRTLSAFWSQSETYALTMLSST